MSYTKCWYKSKVNTLCWICGHEAYKSSSTEKSLNKKAGKIIIIKNDAKNITWQVNALCLIYDCEIDHRRRKKCERKDRGKVARRWEIGRWTRKER